VAAAPAVAFAATDEDNDNVTGPSSASTTAHAKELRRDAKVKLEAAVARAKHERKEARERRRERRLDRQQAAAAPTAATAGTTAAPHLEAIASCESGGDPSAVDASGTYRGKYQFDYATWASVGGSGDPAAAPEAEQDMRAQMLYERSGASPWPVCGQ
jgi:hypothetical protein